MKVPIVITDLLIHVPTGLWELLEDKLFVFYPQTLGRQLMFP